MQDAKVRIFSKSVLAAVLRGNRTISASVYHDLEGPGTN